MPQFCSVIDLLRVEYFRTGGQTTTPVSIWHWPRGMLLSKQLFNELKSKTHPAAITFLIKIPETVGIFASCHKRFGLETFFFLPEYRLISNCKQKANIKISTHSMVQCVCQIQLSLHRHRVLCDLYLANCVRGCGAWACFASTSYSRCKKMLMNCSILRARRLQT